jgi:hypothetical protein
MPAILRKGDAMEKSCKFCGTVPGPGERACRSRREAIDSTEKTPFGCPWLIQAEIKDSAMFDEWLANAQFANIFRHGLELADEMDACLRERVRSEIKSAARNHYMADKLKRFRDMVNA